MLFFECLLCTLALSRGVQAFIFDRSQFRNGNLISVLLRDSVLYFFVYVEFFPFNYPRVLTLTELDLVFTGCVLPI
jgi:hypothetical protein